MITIKPITECLLLLLLSLYYLTAADYIELNASSVCQYCTPNSHVAQIWSGDVSQPGVLLEALQKRSYKKEIVLIVDNRIDNVYQAYSSLRTLNLLHVLWICSSLELCASSQEVLPELACGWISQGLPHDTPMVGPRLTALVKLMITARAVNLGFNVLALDADTIVFREPYWHLKTPPFSDKQLIVMKGLKLGSLSPGAIYVQGAAPDGPVSWLLAEAVLRNLAWMEQRVDLPSNLDHQTAGSAHRSRSLLDTGDGGGALGSGQDGSGRPGPSLAQRSVCEPGLLLTDVVLSAVAGQRIAWQCFRPGAGLLVQKRSGSQAVAESQESWDAQHASAVKGWGPEGLRNLCHKDMVRLGSKGNHSWAHLVGARSFPATWAQLSRPPSQDFAVAHPQGYWLDPATRQMPSLAAFDKQLQDDLKLVPAQPQASQKQRRLQQQQGSVGLLNVAKMTEATQRLSSAWENVGVQKQSRVLRGGAVGWSSRGLTQEEDDIEEQYEDESAAVQPAQQGAVVQGIHVHIEEDFNEEEGALQDELGAKGQQDRQQAATASTTATSTKSGATTDAAAMHRSAPVADGGNGALAAAGGASNSSSAVVPDAGANNGTTAAASGGDAGDAADTSGNSTKATTSGAAAAHSAATTSSVATDTSNSAGSAVVVAPGTSGAEMFAMAPEHIFGSWYNRGAYGFWDPLLAGAQPMQVVGQMTGTPGGTIGREAVRMLSGTFNWTMDTLLSSVTNSTGTSGGVGSSKSANTGGVQNGGATAPAASSAGPANETGLVGFEGVGAGLPSMITLSPLSPLMQAAANREQWASILRGLAQVAALSGRMVIWPDPYCNISWLNPIPTPTTGKLPLTRNLQVIPHGGMPDLRCTLPDVLNHGCLYDRQGSGGVWRWWRATQSGTAEALAEATRYWHPGTRKKKKAALSRERRYRHGSATGAGTGAGANQATLPLRGMLLHEFRQLTSKLAIDFKEPWAANLLRVVPGVADKQPKMRTSLAAQAASKQSEQSGERVKHPGGRRVLQDVGGPTTGASGGAGASDAAATQAGAVTATGAVAGSAAVGEAQPDSGQQHMSAAEILAAEKAAEARRAELESKQQQIHAEGVQSTQLLGLGSEPLHVSAADVLVELKKVNHQPVVFISQHLVVDNMPDAEHKSFEELRESCKAL